VRTICNSLKKGNLRATVKKMFSKKKKKKKIKKKKRKRLKKKGGVNIDSASE